MTEPSAMAPCVYDYSKFSDFFREYVKWRKGQDPKFSYQYWARRLPAVSVTLLKMIGSGQRLPSDKVLALLVVEMQLAEDERLYCQILLGYEKASSLAEREYFVTKLAELRPNAPVTILSHDISAYLSNWQGFAILSLLKLKDFQSDPQWIAQRLGGRLSAAECAEQITLLLKLGLVVVAEGELRRTEKELMIPSLPNNSQVSQALKAFHESHLSLAKECLYTQTGKERYFTGTTLPLNSAKVAEAMNLIIDFRNKFLNLIAADEGDEVYHFAMQLYRLSARTAAE